MTASGVRPSRPAATEPVNQKPSSSRPKPALHTDRAHTDRHRDGDRATVVNIDFGTAPHRRRSAGTLKPAIRVQGRECVLVVPIVVTHSHECFLGYEIPDQAIQKDSASNVDTAHSFTPFDWYDRLCLLMKIIGLDWPLPTLRRQVERSQVIRFLVYLLL